jgi:hypothetical protein
VVKVFKDKQEIVITSFKLVQKSLSNPYQFKLYMRGRGRQEGNIIATNISKRLWCDSWTPLY